MTSTAAIGWLKESKAAIELVKWDTPTDELLGTARIIRHLLDERGACANDICIAAPNRVWANQVRRACESVGLDAVLCMPAERLSASAQVALAKLELLVAFNEGSFDVGSAGFEQAAEASGLSLDEAARFATTYGAARGFTLVRALGLEDVPEADVALLHVAGDEDAPSLRGIMAEQLASPAVPEGSTAIAVRLIGSLAKECKRLFMIGCVDGLVPRAPRDCNRGCGCDSGGSGDGVGSGPGAGSGNGSGSGNSAPCGKPGHRGCEPDVVSSEAESFARTLALAQQQVVVSGFSKVEADIAQRANIRSARSKVEHGKRMAMVSLTPFLLDAGDARPTTVGGQAYLRSHGLN